MDTARSLDDLVTMLSQGLGHRSLYFESHPRVQEVAAEFASELNHLLRSERREFFFLGFVEGRLVHEGRFLIGPTILGRRVVDFLDDLDSGGILFTLGVSASDILIMLNVATELKGRNLDLPRLRAALEQQGAKHIKFSPPYRDPGWFGDLLCDGDGSPESDARADGPDARMVTVYQSMFDSVDRAHRHASHDSELDIDGVRTVGESLVMTVGDTFTDVMELVRYPDYDTFTVGHSVRVASIAVLVAQRAGMSPQFQMEIATAGMLHDVGKSRIPEEILFKTSELDESERLLMDRHPVLGAQILLEHKQAGPMSIAAAWGHHLRFDGGGYPGLPDWGVTGRVTGLLKVCDVFEALTAIRPYKSAMTARRAYEIMLGDRGSYDPGAFRALVSAMGVYPPGSFVLLSNGEQGVVERSGAHIDRPVVRVTVDRAGNPAAADTQTRDLSEPGIGIHIVRSLISESARARAEGENADGTDLPHLCSHPHDHRDDDIGRFLKRSY
jgi:HD-GYP domain-containing protein (c-di-GMP phosphodiesterase class II)